MDDLAEPACDQIWIGDLPAETDDFMLRQIFASYGEIVWCKTLAPKQGLTTASALVQFGDPNDAKFCAENLNGNIAEGLERPVKVRLSAPKGGGGGSGSSWNNRSGGGGDGGSNWSSGDGWSKTRIPVVMPGTLQVPGGGFGKAGAAGAHPNLFDPYSDGGKGFGGKRGIAGMIKGAITGGYIAKAQKKTDENSVYVKNLPCDTTDRDLYELFAPFGAIPPGGVLAKQKDGQCCGVGFVDFVEVQSVEKAVAALHGLPGPEGEVLHVQQKRKPKVEVEKEQDPEALARQIEQSFA
eukprot:TRINITY_DN48863_c0_g1_i1.p1 TRINITY_DN48863_c0_g1~~TRINITY_DN48863_c0_g1_i1.p1  ORF type:complete len:307 (+),score=60.29 TRINITY_DN48863_c0_g1_i1:38-922(+)